MSQRHSVAKSELHEYGERMERLFMLLRPEAHHHIIEVDKSIRMQTARELQAKLGSEAISAQCACSSEPVPVSTQACIAEKATKIAAHQNTMGFRASILVLYLLLICTIIGCSMIYVYNLRC